MRAEVGREGRTGGPPRRGGSGRKGFMSGFCRRWVPAPGGVAPPRHRPVLAGGLALPQRARISASPTGTERNPAGRGGRGPRSTRSNRASFSMACCLTGQGLQEDSQHSVQNPKKRLEKPLRFERIHPAPQVALPRDPPVLLEARASPIAKFHPDFHSRQLRISKGQTTRFTRMVLKGTPMARECQTTRQTRSRNRATLFWRVGHFVRGCRTAGAEVALVA